MYQIGKPSRFGTRLAYSSGMAHRILIVEDDDAVRFCLGEALRRHGYEVDLVAGLEDARKMLSCRSYSLVFTDLRLDHSQQMGGLEVVDIIRETSPVTRTVVLSGGGYAEAEKYALNHRADMFLRKPVGMREIGAVAAQLLGTAALLI